MGAIPAQHEIERAVVERKALRRGLLRDDIVQSALRRRLLHLREHVGRQIAGDDFTHMRRGAIADMAAAASKIERAGVGASAHEGLDLIEVGAAAMHGAADIGRGARRVMAGDKIMLARGSRRFSRLRSHFPAKLNLLQVAVLSWYKTFHDAVAARPAAPSRRFSSPPPRAIARRRCRPARQPNGATAHAGASPRGDGADLRDEPDLVRLDRARPGHFGVRRRFRAAGRRDASHAGGASLSVPAHAQARSSGAARRRLTKRARRAGILRTP